MPVYSESQIEQIKNRLTISEVISPYVRLTRKGDRYWGLCPFHHEKTPSFTVKDDGGFYKCFGCGKGGSMFDFIMEVEKVTFPEAVEILAKKANVELRHETEQEKKNLSRKKTLQDLYNRIADSFHAILLTKSYAEDARNYMKKRGISDETCDKFKLGFAPDDPKLIYDLLHKNGFSDELLKNSGLFSRGTDDFYPFFRNRFLFPIRTWQGNVVAFSGRDMTGTDRAKYKNSPDTELYSKRNILFGLYESLPMLKTKSEVILCEGNFDVISLHQAGLAYAVAPLGTSFTDEQAKLLRRWISKVYILFDSDDAGQNATSKAILICQQNDIESSVIRLQGAKDASQMLEEQGPQALVSACENSITGFSYLVYSAKKKYDLRQPKSKSSVFKEVKPFLDATSSGIERQGYIKLLSEELGVSEEQIIGDYAQQRKNVPADIEQEEVRTGSKKRNLLNIPRDLNAMLLLMNNRSEFEAFRSMVKINELKDPDAQHLYAVLENASREEVKDIDLVLQMIGNEDLKNLIVLSFDSAIYKPANPAEAVKEAANGIHAEELLEKRRRIQGMVNSGAMEGVPGERLIELMETLRDLDNELLALKKDEVI